MNQPVLLRIGQSGLNVNVSAGHGLQSLDQVGLKLPKLSHTSTYMHHKNPCIGGTIRNCESLDDPSLPESLKSQIKEHIKLLERIPSEDDVAQMVDTLSTDPLSPQAFASCIGLLGILKSKVAELTRPQLDEVLQIIDREDLPQQIRVACVQLASTQLTNPKSNQLEYLEKEITSRLIDLDVQRLPNLANALAVSLASLSKLSDSTVSRLDEVLKRAVFNEQEDAPQEIAVRLESALLLAIGRAANEDKAIEELQKWIYSERLTSPQFAWMILASKDTEPARRALLHLSEHYWQSIQKILEGHFTSTKGDQYQNNEQKFLFMQGQLATGVASMLMAKCQSPEALSLLTQIASTANTTKDFKQIILIALTKHLEANIDIRPWKPLLEIMRKDKAKGISSTAKRILREIK